MCFPAQAVPQGLLSRTLAVDSETFLKQWLHRRCQHRGGLGAGAAVAVPAVEATPPQIDEEKAQQEKTQKTNKTNTLNSLISMGQYLAEVHFQRQTVGFLPHKEERAHVHPRYA